MTKQAIHRYTADSKVGHQIMASGTRIERGSGLTPEQQEHNARVEAARLAKLERRKARREEGK